MYAIIDKCNQDQLKNVIFELKKHWRSIRLQLDANNDHLLDEVFNIGGADSYEFHIKGTYSESLINKLSFYNDVFRFRVVLDIDSNTDLNTLNALKGFETVLHFELNKDMLDKIKKIDDCDQFIYYYHLDYSNIDESLIRDFIEFASDNMLSIEVDKDIPSCLLSDDLYFDLTVLNKETAGNNLMSYIIIDENLDYMLSGHNQKLGTIVNRRMDQIISHIEKECSDLIFSPASKACYTCKCFLSKGYKNCYLRR